MFALLSLLITGAAGVFGYLATRDFVTRRLRFVDAVQSPVAPIVAGIVAAVAALPLTILPLIGAGTALMFGTGVGLGTRAGIRRIRDGLYLGRGS